MSTSSLELLFPASVNRLSLPVGLMRGLRGRGKDLQPLPAHPAALRLRQPAPDPEALIVRQSPLQTLQAYRAAWTSISPPAHPLGLLGHVLAVSPSIWEKQLGVDPPTLRIHHPGWLFL